VFHDVKQMPVGQPCRHVALAMGSDDAYASAAMVADSSCGAGRVDSSRAG